MTISGYEDVPRNSEESLLKALAHQPVSVAVEASGRDFQFYRGVSDSCHTDMSVETRRNRTCQVIEIWWPAGNFRRTLWDPARSWCGSCGVWDIQGPGLHHGEELMGPQLGRKGVHQNEEKHRKARRSMRHLQDGFVSYQQEVIHRRGLPPYEIKVDPRFDSFPSLSSYSIPGVYLNGKENAY